MQIIKFNTPKIYFTGFSKNCYSNLNLNLSFLINFIENSKLNSEIIIIDSDSIDGTKEYCNKLQDKGKLTFIEIDNLENSLKSRIERITHCRNVSIKFIKNQNQEDAIYIPMDMDLNLFKFLDNELFEQLIQDFINSEFDGIFPFSLPFYYDIFALRADRWVKKNNLLIANKVKKKYKVISFFTNFLLIYKKQIPIKKAKGTYIKVRSAFGGMGMYKLKFLNLPENPYKIDIHNVDFFCEHVSFNSNFQNLNINTEWNISAPEEYIKFNLLSGNKKIVFFLKSFKNDLINLFKK